MKIKNFDTKKKILIVGEIGNNHEGCFKTAKKLINMAAKAGVDAVKFQTYKTEKFILINDKKNFKKFKKFEFSFSQFRKLKSYANQKKLLFISSALDLESASFLIKNSDAIKVASSDNDFSLLYKKILKSKKPLIISTGFLNSNDINNLIRKLAKIRRSNITVLHCVSCYPTEKKEVNLSSIRNMKNNFGVEYGYSDHTIGVEACLCAASLGARIIEKHITLDKNFSNFRDHKLSSDYKELKELVKQIRKIELILGNKFKNIQKGENRILKAVRRKPYASKIIKKNDKFTEKNLNFLRSSISFKKTDINKLIDKKSKKNFRINQMIDY
ncbi:N-acetylneuraminate synthase family protein [Candidatus Pelagibacter communis]|uniref:N-acetylneuraminate synthase family protein n=1 Tax=Pelagibacter ubique TaxID=198252 RepID=UPI00094DA98A|nr:N-acetylneuraminate synthase family protein [Candidatus Pelagibacter ubique]